MNQRQRTKEALAKGRAALAKANELLKRKRQAERAAERAKAKKNAAPPPEDEPEDGWEDDDADDLDTEPEATGTAHEDEDLDEDEDDQDDNEIGYWGRERDRYRQDARSQKGKILWCKLATGTNQEGDDYLRLDFNLKPHKFFNYFVKSWELEEGCEKDLDLGVMLPQKGDAVKVWYRVGKMRNGKATRTVLYMERC